MQMDDITKQLKTNNMKIHGLVTQVMPYMVPLRLHCWIRCPCVAKQERTISGLACLQIRSTKHFCVDVILVVVLLSLTGVIIQTVVKK
jgi:hypothetical protein